MNKYHMGAFKQDAKYIPKHVCLKKVARIGGKKQV